MKGDDVKNMIKDDRTRFTLRTPKKLFEFLQNNADELGVSTNALIVQILWEWLKDKE
mgnify:FL=1